MFFRRPSRDGSWLRGAARSASIGYSYGGLRGRLLAWSDEPRNGFSDGNYGSHIRRYSRKDSVARSFHFDDRFIRLDFEERLALGDVLAFLFTPS